MRPALMKPTEKRLICSAESSPHPKGKLIIFFPAGAPTSPPLLPLPPCQTFAQPNSINSSAIRAFQHVSQLEGEGEAGSQSKPMTSEELRPNGGAIKASDAGWWIYVTGCLKMLALLGVMDLAEAIPDSVPCDSDDCIDFRPQPGESILSPVKHLACHCRRLHTWLMRHRGQNYYQHFKKVFVIPQSVATKE